MKRIIIVLVIRAGLGAALMLAAILSVSCGAPPADPCLGAVQALANEVDNARANWDPPGCLDELDAWCDCQVTIPGPPGDYGPRCACPAAFQIEDPCAELWQVVVDNCDGACLQSFTNAPQWQKNAANTACGSSTNQRMV